MKNIKVLPISIATIILVAFLAISFSVFNASESVAIKGVSGSYAQTYAKENNIEFIQIDDSENPKVEIPKTENKNTNVSEKASNEKTAKSETTTTTKPAVKENKEFSYNYVNNTISITGYKGNSSEVNIPETIDDLPVKEIKLDVLNKGITTVQIPESVTSIDTKFTSARYTAYFYTAIIILAVGYAFSIASTFVGFKMQQNAEGTFYGVPFVYSGLSTFILVAILSGISIFVGVSPLLQAIIAIVIFACALGKLLKKSVARELIVERGEQVKKQTQFIKMLSADAQTLNSTVKSDTAKELTQKVYETIRYSDPMSTDALLDIEKSIQEKFDEFESCVNKDDVDNAKIVADELISLIKKRNNRCKVLK